MEVSTEGGVIQWRGERAVAAAALTISTRRQSFDATAQPLRESTSHETKVPCRISNTSTRIRRDSTRMAEGQGPAVAAAVAVVAEHATHAYKALTRGTTL